MALVFPATPTLGQKFPADPGTSGVSQWSWDGNVWSTVPVFVRTNNTTAFNSYVWPNTQAPTPGFQLTDNLADANLSWEIPGSPLIYIDDISGSFNGVTTGFPLAIAGASYTPSPTSNIMVFIGGVAQTPGAANDYTIAGSTISFVLPPSTGASFSATTVF